MNELFKTCVILLEQLAALTNTTYEEINIYIFVIAMPLMLILLIISNFILTLKLWKRNKATVSNGKL
ncbi:hypothetical protein [Sphingobacterium lactis]|uniref:Uncharacterized protein n=1 Tax=Sphingobacterium lactis TaxID=797291 RepID=A0A1H6BFR6_9SPHI|nr:hypothetical protein [Sphingobacterium lactis]SEG59500.1 hypothetical protein SAMN05421877_11082 [Sphingobacterium lactis]